MMKARRNTAHTLSFLALLVSSVLMITNGVLIAMNDAPLIVSSYPATHVENVTQPMQFWGRIVFGVPNLVEGGRAYFWIFVTAWMAVIAFMVYFRPKKQKYLSRWALLLAKLSIPIGAGCYI
jgi:hypothetical protein